MTSPNIPPEAADLPLIKLQNQLISRSLLIVTAIIVLGFARAIATGWFPLDYGHLIIAVLTLTSWLQREKLAAKQLAIGLLVLVCCYATSNLMQFGLASSSLAVFLVGGFVCAVVFGNYATLILALLASLAFVFSGFMYYQQNNLSNWSEIPHAADYAAWAAIAISSLLFIPVASEYLNGLKQSAEDALNHTQHKNTERSASSSYDPLTGLPVLHITLDRLRHELDRAKRNASLGAVMFVDVDNFTAVNTEFGSEGGNQVLRTLSARIVSIVRASDTISRIGGDEFVAIFADQEDEEQVRLIARKLLATVNNPITFNQHTINLQVSIGVSLFPEHSVSPQELMSLAHQTVKLVKLAGGNNFRIASTEL